MLSTIASLEMRRLTNCSADISSEKMQTALPEEAATLVATFMANEVFPIPGRAPTSTRSELPMPTSTRSTPENPVGVPAMASLSSASLCRVSSVSRRTSRMARKLRESRPCEISRNCPWA